MNYTLKKYVHRAQGACRRLGYSLKVTETPRETVVLFSNPDSQRVALIRFGSNELGELGIRSYVVDKKNYRWAREEGFTVDQMIEIKEEKIFMEVDPNKIPNYLL